MFIGMKQHYMEHEQEKIEEKRKKICFTLLLRYLELFSNVLTVPKEPLKTFYAGFLNAGLDY